MPNKTKNWKRTRGEPLNYLVFKSWPFINFKNDCWWHRFYL